MGAWAGGAQKEERLCTGETPTRRRPGQGSEKVLRCSLLLLLPGSLGPHTPLPLGPTRSPPPGKGKNLAPPPTPQGPGPSPVAAPDNQPPRGGRSKQDPPPRPLTGQTLTWPRAPAPQHGAEHGASTGRSKPPQAPGATLQLSPSLQISSLRRKTGPEAPLGALTLTTEEAQARLMKEVGVCYLLFLFCF